jgi:hypothetical protein
MEYDEMTLRLQQLPSSKHVSVVAAFGVNLTIVARDTYVVGELGIHAPERLRAINEIQHRLLEPHTAVTEAVHQSISGRRVALDPPGPR